MVESIATCVNKHLSLSFFSLPINSTHTKTSKSRFFATNKQKDCWICQRILLSYLPLQCYLCRGGDPPTTSTVEPNPASFRARAGTDKPLPSLISIQWIPRKVWYTCLTIITSSYPKYLSILPGFCTNGIASWCKAAISRP